MTSQEAMSQLFKAVHPLLKEMVEGDIPFTFSAHGVIVDGFYKSGTVRLVPCWDGDKVMKWDVFDRYTTNDAAQTITYFADLVALNADWWRRSYNRMEKGWSIDERWKKHLIAAGFAEEQTICVPVQQAT
jgi:hypothetical protein